MNKKHNFKEQLDKFYSGRLASHEIFIVGIPSLTLQELGMSKSPIVLKQNTMRKCIREERGSRSAHELGRDIIEKLPEQIENPIFAIKAEERKSISLITDFKDNKGNNIFIAIRLDTKVKEQRVNEIKSIYGKEYLKEILEKYSAFSQLVIMDKEKAEEISRVIGLQLPKTLINLDYKNTLQQKRESVNKGYQQTS